MNLELPPISIAELARRIALRFDAGDWLVLVTPTNSIQQAVLELQEELSDQEIPVSLAKHLSSTDALIAAAQRQPHVVLVISEVDNLAEQEWRLLDLRRAALQRSACVIVMLQRPTLIRILSAAPNLASWISGSLWRLSPLGDQLPPEEVEQRLIGLRHQFSMDDNEVLRLAQAQQLPREPEFGEWLILLGRGELI